MEDVKLKTPQVVRLFISSPFNGMEKERDILTKYYWPKIESALSAKGLHLKLVDMRWGITSSSSSAAQTINICLKEIDRSDVFIGLFGQRYGWNGRNDPELQENFNKAAEKFPWVDQYRDRSVTEVEFMHGHLNNPGNIPACFCFRDKMYDDKMRKEVETNGNVKKQNNFKAENENSFEKLEALKASVHITESKTLGVSMNYKDPQEAAEFIYKKIWNYVENEILAKIQKPISEKEKVTLAHKAYQASQCGLYVGGQKYVDKLYQYIINTDNDKYPLTITGPTGCGKTSLLSNWLQQETKADVKDEKQMFYFHFVGAEPDSIQPRYIMTRLIDYVLHALNGEEFNYKEEEEKKKLSMAKLTEKMAETLALLGKFKDKQLIIVIDNIDKISRSKTSMPLFWLPKDLPSNVRVILSLTEGAPDVEDLWEVLTEVHKTKRMNIEPLTEEEKKEMCSKLLEENSKSMDHEQLLMITNSERTKNPFFLKILINELCVAGRFRKLNQQISNLLDSNGILGILVKVLERIQEDYANTEYEGNVVEEVLCALCLCKKGISESELPMPQHVWAPVVYALKPFLTDRGSILGFAFTELNEAVQIVYMATEEKKRAIAKKVSDIFVHEYETCRKSGKKIDERTASELLHLLRLSDDRILMIKVLGDIRIFQSIGATGNFQLNEYWQWLATPSPAIANRYVRSLDAFIAEEYAAYLEHCEMDRWHTVLKMKSDLILGLRNWFEDSKLYHGTEYLLDRELELDRNRPGVAIMKRKEYMCVIKYQKACHLCEIEKYHEALQLHKEVLEFRKELIKADAMDKEDKGISYHGIGLCHFQLKEYDEAERWYKMALEVWVKPDSQISRANTHCNIGNICVRRQDYDKALEQFEKSNALRDEAEPNKLSLEVAYNYHNIGLVHKRRKNYDMAEKFYLKTLKVKEALLGRNSVDFALSIMNMGSLEVSRKNHEKSYEYALEALSIFKVVAPVGSFRITQAKENAAVQLTLLDRYEEAEPLFLEVLADLKKMPGGLADGLPSLHRRFIKWYLNKDRYEEAAEVALELIKCSKCKPQDYAYLASADDSLPPEKKKDRPETTTLDYGLKKYPLNKDILMMKLDILSRRRSLKELVAFICKYCEDDTLPGNTEDRYVLAADILKDDVEDLKKAIVVLEAATKDKPERLVLLEKLKTFQALK